MLTPDVEAAWGSILAGMPNTYTVSHYLNLSRGLLAVDHLNGSSAGVVRIPSTWCEQKLWGRILETTSSVFFFDMAVGRHVVVHDRSEKRRETRAIWQGLSWVRYAVNRIWGLKGSTEITRNGMDVTDYWEKCYRALPKSTVSLVRYYKDYLTIESGSGGVRLSGCYDCKQISLGGTDA